MSDFSKCASRCADAPEKYQLTKFSAYVQFLTLKHIMKFKNASLTLEPFDKVCQHKVN